CNPCMLEKQALLRINVFCFAGRDVEKSRIEFIDAGDKTAPFAVMAPALTTIFTKIFLPVPAFPGYFDDAIFSFAQVVPICVDIDCFRIASAQSNDRYILN